jgi:hypothetical protein
MALSCAITFLFGVLHLYYTFTGNNLLPRDPAVRTAMEAAHLSITKETSVLRAWIGFNASHSIALMLFGAVFGFLAVQHDRLLFGSVSLLAIGFAFLAASAVLAKLYWFSVPFMGVLVALGCYVAAAVASRI